MDIEELEGMRSDPIPNGTLYDLTKSFYKLILLPPSFGWPQETFAIISHVPATNYTGGALRAFNLNKKIGGQMYFNSRYRLFRAYHVYSESLIEKRNGKLVWEGKINGFNKQIKSEFESAWLN